ncbi:MAG: threonylcarbamoyl-AMP synthase [Thermoflavifilum sp.]|nr:threonylcarbamoyl-AMP synthase [Thermoflavifilum sp.]
MKNEQPLFLEDVEACLQVLRRGGIILYPTDTIWGIGCDATLADAVQRIYMLKQRPASKSMIILLADERDILQYVADPHPHIFDYLKTTDRPTTVIYEHALHLPENLINEDGSIAIRIVKEPFCKTLIKRLRKPLVSTSANVSGAPSPAHFHEVSDVIKQGVDYVVRYRQDDFSPSRPSRIVKFTTDGQMIVIRP